MSRESVAMYKRTVRKAVMTVTRKATARVWGRNLLVLDDFYDF